MHGTHYGRRDSISFGIRSGFGVGYRTTPGEGTAEIAERLMIANRVRTTSGKVSGKTAAGVRFRIYRVLNARSADGSPRKDPAGPARKPRQLLIINGEIKGGLTKEINLDKSILRRRRTLFLRDLGKAGDSAGSANGPPRGMFIR